MKTMDFVFRIAGAEDVPAIDKMIRQAKSGITDPDWFEAEDMEFVRRHISEEGFIILAQPEIDRTNTAALLIVRFPKREEDNLGEYLELSEEEMQKVAHLEIAVVSPEFRGNSLQYKLLVEAQLILKNGWNELEIRYLMATVHPENVYSLRNVERFGMKIAADVKKYGGKRRFVMWKNLDDEYEEGK